MLSAPPPSVFFFLSYSIYSYSMARCTPIVSCFRFVLEHTTRATTSTLANSILRFRVYPAVGDCQLRSQGPQRSIDFGESRGTKTQGSFRSTFSYCRNTLQQCACHVYAVRMQSDALSPTFAGKSGVCCVCVCTCVCVCVCVGDTSS